MIRRTGEAAATCALARTQGAGRARKMRGFALTMHSSNSELAVLFMLLPKTSSLQAEAAKSEESVTAVQQVEASQRMRAPHEDETLPRQKAGRSALLPSASRTLRRQLQRAARLLLIDRSPAFAGAAAV
eukprot:21360-Pleurochrysis_carterae.AAC.2